MSVIHNDLLLSSDNGSYTIAKSLRFRSSASAYIARTPSSTGDRQKWTWSGWVKRGNLGDLGKVLAAYNNSGNSIFALRFEANNTLNIYSFNTATEAYIWQVQTTQVFRDPSAWYHIVLAFDTTQATAANRIKLYINGSQVTAFSASSYPSQNTNTELNANGYSMQIGTGTANNSTFTQNFDGYLAETYLIDGTQKVATDFGETDSVTGVWKPKAYSGTYGTNGFYLKFTDVATTSGSNAGLGKDFSGNGNYWTTNNISVTSGSTYDSMKDVPTLTDTDTANYAVLNPLGAASGATLSNGNLQLQTPVSGGGESQSTIAIPSSGKWYWEYSIVGGTASEAFCGVQKQNTSSAFYVRYYSGNGNKYIDGVASSYGTTYTTNDIIGVAVDSTAGTIVFYKNNTSQGSISYATSSGDYFAVIADGSPSTSTTFSVNFGQQPFSYTPPTGYKALNTYNLPDSTIVAGNKVMDATTFTSTGTTQSITNAGSFKPDLVWTKQRNATNSNYLNDSVRGASNYLVSDSTAAEASASQYLTAFNSNGFTLGTSNYANGNSIVGWQWQAGQGTTSSNTSGSITSTVSVNASAGFSVVSWTGTGSNATVGHGLGVTPKLIITKNRAVGTTDWVVYHASLGATNYIRLNLSNAQSTSAIAWNNTTPTSSVFSVGTWDSANGNGNAMISYCWSEIAGFSKFGTYTGTGSADTPFIYTGFRPKFVMTKKSNAAESWAITDSSRSAYNYTQAALYANASGGDDTTPQLNLLSNGFSIHSTHTINNASGDTYLYIAFAENPFKNALAR